MKASQAIDRTDRLKPNSYSYADKLVWLSQLDGTIRREIMDRYGDGAAGDFVPYTERDGQDGELLAEEPYDEMYIHYLSAQIDYFNGEFERFNNANRMFETAFSAFRNAYNRAHSAKENRKNYW